MFYNEIIDESLYDEVFQMPFDNVETEVGREYLSDLKSYEAVPSDGELKEPKAIHKNKIQDHSGNHRQADLSKKIDSHEQASIPEEQMNTQNHSNLQELVKSKQGQSNLQRITSFKRQTDQSTKQFDRSQVNDMKNIMMSPPKPFISWGRQHLPKHQLADNPSPPTSLFDSKPSLDSPTLRNLFGSSPTNRPEPQSGGDKVWAITKTPERRSGSDYFRPKRDQGGERKEGFKPPQISYYFTLDDAINRNSLSITQQRQILDFHKKNSP